MKSFIFHVDHGEILFSRPIDFAVQYVRLKNFAAVKNFHFTGSGKYPLNTMLIRRIIAVQNIEKMDLWMTFWYFICFWIRFEKLFSTVIVQKSHYQTLDRINAHVTIESLKQRLSKEYMRSISVWDVLLLTLLHMQNWSVDTYIVCVWSMVWWFPTMDCSLYPFYLGCSHSVGKLKVS